MDDFGGEVKGFVNASQTGVAGITVSVQPYAFTDLQAVGATGAGACWYCKNICLWF